MAKKSVKRSKAKTVPRQVQGVERVTSWKLWASFYNMLLFLALALVCLALSSFVVSKFWITVFVLTMFLATFLSLAFFIVWIVLLFLKWTK